MRASEAAVIEQRLRPLGYKGGHSILLECLKEARPQAQPARAFVRLEPAPGDRFEVDWGHIGALDYSCDKPNCSRLPTIVIRHADTGREFTVSAPRIEGLDEQQTRRLIPAS
jgi:hypothetical protein